MVFCLEGPPKQAADQLISHLKTLPGFADLFPEPEILAPLFTQPHSVPGSSPGEGDQEHAGSHSGVPEVQQAEAPPHGPPLEARVAAVSYTHLTLPTILLV